MAATVRGAIRDLLEQTRDRIRAVASAAIAAHAVVTARVAMRPTNSV